MYRLRVQILKQPEMQYEMQNKGDKNRNLKEAKPVMRIMSMLLSREA
jgi:hypothetical protein